jgi:hypothetical protein
MQLNHLLARGKWAHRKDFIAPGDGGQLGGLHRAIPQHRKPFGMCIALPQDADVPATQARLRVELAASEFFAGQVNRGVFLDW